MTAPPAMVNGKQFRLSWSRMRAHQECRQKGHLQSLGKRSPTADIRGYFHGTVVDRAYRDWLNLPEQDPGWMIRNVAEIMDREEKTARETGDGVVKWRTPTDKSEVLEFCQETVRRLAAISKDLVLPYEWEPDVRFSVPMEVPYLDGSLRQIKLIGAMDLLVRRPEGVEIWDLKATRDNNYHRKVTGQMMFYDIAWWAMSEGRRALRTGLIQPMCDQPVYPFEFDDAARRQMFSSICRVSMDVFRNDVAPKADSGGCTICPVRHACPKFGAPSGRGRVAMQEVRTA
jgi:hypothetical protein